MDTHHNDEDERSGQSRVERELSSSIGKRKKVTEEKEGRSGIDSL